jgi:hypothetical protein
MMMPIETSGRWAQRRVLLTATGLVVALALGACSTVHVTQTTALKTPLFLQGVQAIFEQTEYRMPAERSYLSNAEVNQQRADLAATFVDVFPATLRSSGMPAEARALTPPLNGAQSGLANWLGMKPKAWHVLVVTPSSGRAFCPTAGNCNFKFGIHMRLLSPDSRQELWAATLKQPDVTPGATLGRRADYEHYSREMARTLLEQVASRGARP